MQFDSAPQNQPKQSLSFRFGRGMMLAFSKLLIIPGMKRALNHTFLGSCSYVNALTKKGQSRQALKHLVKVLQSSRFRTVKTYRWWYLMRQAISIAQDTQLDGGPAPLDEINQIIELGKFGPGPRTGYDAAYSFIGLGLWAFQMGDRNQAIQYVHQATMADKEWGYPEYLLGWLALFSKEIDPIPHFVNALKINWSFFHRINKDPVCQQHPEIIKKVRQQVLMTSSKPLN